MQRIVRIEPIVLLGSVNIEQLILLRQVAALLVEHFDLAVQFLIQLLEECLLDVRFLLCNPVFYYFALHWIKELVIFCIYCGRTSRKYRIMAVLSRLAAAAVLLDIADDGAKVLRPVVPVDLVIVRIHG